MTLCFCVCAERDGLLGLGALVPQRPLSFQTHPPSRAWEPPGAAHILGKNSGDEKKFMEASRSLFSRPRRGLFSQPWEGECVREQSSMRWEWARSPSYLWRPPSSAPKRASESGGVGGGRRTIDGGNKQSGEVYHSVCCYLRHWMQEESLFSPLMVSNVFRSQRHSSRSIQHLSTGSQGQQVQYIKKKVGESITWLVWSRGHRRTCRKKVFYLERQYTCYFIYYLFWI